MRNGLFIALISFVPATTLVAKKKKITNPVQQPAGPISNPETNCYRSVVTCPVCPNFICTGITGITGITGCTGPGCTGPCIPDITSNFCCLEISQSATVRGFVTAETETISGNLTVGANANFKDELIVEGKGDLRQNACIQNNLSVGNDFSVGGFEVILGTLNANSGALINGNLTQIGNEILNGSLSITGNSTVAQNLTVNGAASFAGLLTANSPSGPSLSVFNGSIVNNGLIILNSSCTAPTGPTFCTGAIINGNFCTIGDELVAGDFNVGGDLTVDKNAIFNSDFISNSTFITNNTVTMNDGLTIAQGDEIINVGNLQLIDSAGVFEVNGQSTFQGAITANAGALMSCGLIVEDGQTVPLGDFEIPQGSAIVEGSVNAGGSIISNMGRSQFANLNITSTQNSLCSTGPAALTVNGGIGIAKDLWEGNCQYFADVEAEGGTPGCLDYYEESSYTTAFIWGGLTVNPPISLTIRIIRVGNIVNLYIPEIIYNNPAVHIDVITSTNPLPARFRPTSTIRGASSTIIYRNINSGDLVGELGEFDISPSGIITFGLSGDALAPQRIVSDGLVYTDINTITYNINGSERTCKRCAG